MARLVLDDGSEFRGNIFGACKSTPGEVGECKSVMESALPRIN